MKAKTWIAPVMLLTLVFGGLIAPIYAQTRAVALTGNTPGQMTPPPPPRAPEPPLTPEAPLGLLGEQLEELRVLGIEGGGGYLGVRIEDVTAETVKELKLKEERGVVIEDVRDDSPAAKAGLKSKDVITRFNGQRIESVSQFTRLLHETPTGRPVELSIIRDGREQEIKATVGSRQARGRLLDPEIHVEVPSMPKEATNWPNLLWTYSSRGRLGVQIQPLSEQLAEYFGVEGKHGLLVSSVIADSPAAKAGIRAGDVIVAVENKKIEDGAELAEILREKEGDVNLTIVRDRQRQTIHVTLETPQSRRIERKRAIRPRVNVVSIGPTL